MPLVPLLDRNRVVSIMDTLQDYGFTVGIVQVSEDEKALSAVFGL